MSGGSRGGAVTLRSRSHPPPVQTQRANFPHYAYLLASDQGLWGLSIGGHCPQRSLRDLVPRKEAQRLVEPLPTPSPSPEAGTLPCPHQVASHLLLDPVSDEAEAPAGVANGKVVHPASEDRIDGDHHFPHRLGSHPPELV